MSSPRGREAAPRPSGVFLLAIFSPQLDPGPRSSASLVPPARVIGAAGVAMVSMSLGKSARTSPETCPASAGVSHPAVVEGREVMVDGNLPPPPCDRNTRYSHRKTLL